MMYGLYGGCMMYGMYGVYGLYGHTLAWYQAWTLYGRPYSAYMPFSVQQSIQRTPRRPSVRALQSSSGSSTKAAPPALAHSAIGTPDERAHRPERAEAPPDDVVSCRAREMVAGVVLLAGMLAGACAVDALTFCW